MFYIQLVLDVNNLKLHIRLHQHPATPSAGAWRHISIDQCVIPFFFFFFIVDSVFFFFF